MVEDMPSIHRALSLIPSTFLNNTPPPPHTHTKEKASFTHTHTHQQTDTGVDIIACNSQVLPSSPWFLEKPGLQAAVRKLQEQDSGNFKTNQLHFSIKHGDKRREEFYSVSVL